jgi:uncharacterized integral membrane protein
MGQHGDRPVLGATSAQAAALVRHSTYHEGGQPMVQSSGDGGAQVAGKEGARLGGGAIATLVGLAVLVVFMIQNTQDVTVEFLFWDFTWSVWLLVLVSALIGALVWFGLGVLRRHRRRKDRREDRRD